MNKIFNVALATSLMALTAFAASDTSIFDQEYLKSKGLMPVHKGDGSEVALLLDEQGQSGELSLAARLQSLVNAERSIRIQALIFRADESGMRVAQLLKWKKRENPTMTIRVNVDAISNLDWDTQWMYFDLKNHGIEVEGYEASYLAWFNDIKANKRFHDKIWVIDAEYADNPYISSARGVVGGLNVANEYFRVDKNSTHNLWRDQDVAVRGPVLKDLAKVFDRNFDFFKAQKAKKPGLFNTDKAWAKFRALQRKPRNFRVFKRNYHPNAEIHAQVMAAEHRELKLDWQPAAMRFFQSRPRLSERFILQAYQDQIRHAAHPGGEIMISNAYFLPEMEKAPEIFNELIAAAQKGAQVTLLTNSAETNDLPQLTYAARYYYKRLLADGRGNFRIFEYGGKPFGEGTLHAKFAVFDRKSAIVGSYNLDPRSQNLNSETALAFDNEQLAGRLAEAFEKFDLKRSYQVTPNQAEAWHDKDFDTKFSLGIAPML